MAIGGKPFSLQAPEQIAKEYGGDKQKIMQAAQMGVVDPTAAVMAGMFIDRMRTAQAAEQAAPPTVAQEVFAPPAPPPMQGAPGMGAPPMVPPQMAPQAGGLEALPVSDAMFSEGEVGMAGGGMVSFAAGGTSYADTVDWLYPLIEEQESGGRPRPGVPTRYGTAQGVAQMLPDTARGVARDLGIPYNEALLMGTDEASIAYQRTLGREYTRQGLEWGGGDPSQAAMFYHGGPNRRIHGDRTRAYADQVLGRRGGTEGGGTRASAPASSSGFPVSLEEFQRLTAAPEIDYEGSIASMEERLAGVLPDTSTIDELMTSLRERNAPEEVKEQRSQDLWGALADFGFRWASSGNLAESAGETFSGLRETIDGRREQEFGDLARMIELEGMNIERAMVPVTMGIEAAQKEAALQGDQRQQTATYLTQIGSGAQAGQQRMAEMERDAELNPPDAADPITPSDLNPHLTQVESDFEALATTIGEGTTNIPQRIRELYAAAKSGQMDQAAARAAGARYYYNAMIAATGGTGAGSSGGASLPAGFVMDGAPQSPGVSDPALRWITGQYRSSSGVTSRR